MASRNPIRARISVRRRFAVLSASGVLAGKRATTHHGAFDRLPELDPKVQVVRHVRYVKDGRVWTSGGISAGIDMSLAMVKELLGDDEPVVVEMEWGWKAGSSSKR